MSRIDLLIFGASGFTGKYAVREIMKIAAKFDEKFTWGVAGRNKEKLKSVLEDQGKKTNYDASEIPIVIADIENEESLNEMAKKTRVIINCCGPYRFYGEPVVKACIANKTHHVDVSGEPQYMERMQLLYNNAAEKNEVYVVSACGFDSIPADLGMIYLKNKFKGVLNSAEIYLDSHCTSDVKFPVVHYGTWKSAIHSLVHYNELSPLRKALYPNKMPEFYPKLKNKFYLHKNNVLNKWCLPFPGSDRSVIKRSQRYFYENENERPIQVNTYVAFSNLFVGLAVVFLAAIFLVLTKFNIGRKLLLKYPEIFSFGFVSQKGPGEETADNTHFSLTFFGKGWTQKLAEPTDKYTESPNKNIITKVSGTNPGYGATCVALILCGLTVLKESNKMPKNGGIYPPGAAFSKTKLIDNLQKFGLTFETLKED